MDNEIKYTYLDCREFGLEIGVKQSDVSAICNSGDNDADVTEVCTQSYIIDQFNSKTDAELHSAVGYLGDDAKRDSRQEAIEFIVWVAAWNIFDEPESE